MATATSRSLVIRRNLEHVRHLVEQAVNGLKSTPGAHSCRLVAVSKTKPVEDIEMAYHLDQRHFGENYIQELVGKVPYLPPDIQWHFIGNLQSNKAKLLVHGVPNLFMIETIDSRKLANLVNKACGQLEDSNRKLKVLIQINTSQEEQKNGLPPGPEAIELAQYIVSSCPHLDLAGLMTIGKAGAPAVEYFQRLRECREDVAQALGWNAAQLELSMGMSGDFEQAIAQGATNVRIGSTIFGAREYAATDTQ